MSIIESLYQYFLDCPLLDGRNINVDYLPAEEQEYSIEPTPAAPIIKQYTNGDSIRQYQFIFGSREYYSENVRENLNNNSFYEQFSDWVQKQSRNGVLPKLPEKMSAISMETLTQGYLYYGDTENAKYQIQCKLTYYQEKGE